MGAAERGEEGGRGEEPLGRGSWRDGGQGLRWAGAAVGGGWVSGMRLMENLNKLQREKNSVSFCLVSSCHSERSGSAWGVRAESSERSGKEVQRKREEQAKTQK